ncbi:unnamed protein product [Ilex paraguariensis]|uniref:ACT domain-containing protein n=1 Tax=Ilex paraguariensis TaxID=185542 RepID=A0ABC8RCG5_9AQUA
MPSEEHASIELIGTDRPALLFEVCAVLANLHCNVVNVEIWTHNARATTIIHVTDDVIGCTIDDTKRLSTIKELLCNILKGNNDLKTTKMTLSPPYLRIGREDYIKSCLLIGTMKRPNLLFDTVCTLTDMLGFRVFVDKRDICMDSMYRKELQSVLGGKAMSLPQVFIRGKHIGGVDEIKQLHEVGELAKLLEGFPTQDPGIVCDSCGDARFVSCLNCNGIRKVFKEEEGKLKRCSNCNENGLIRCPNFYS